MAVRSPAIMAGAAVAAAAGTTLTVSMASGLASHILSKVSQTLISDALPSTLHQFMKVSARRLGCVPRFVPSQKFGLYILPDGEVNSGIWQKLPPDHSSVT